MKELVERGYLYVAQPPLFRIADKDGERYIGKEDEMEDYILKSGVNKVQVILGDGSSITGHRLLSLIKKGIRLDTILSKFQNEGKNREIVRLLAGDPAFKEDDFMYKEVLTRVGKRISMAMADKIHSFQVNIDEEHGGYKLFFNLSENGRIFTVYHDKDIFKLPKFTEARELMQQINNLGGEAPYGVLEKGIDNESRKQFDSMTALIEYVVDSGKKGVTIQRYKGLGEMNPEQLWTTTMDPEKRTLLQVQVEDAVVADEIFTTLMGDQVEPRRDFIYKNALHVSNLDL
jgi:DNA gyrase subunit B